MKRTLLMLTSLALAVTGFAREPKVQPTQLDKANVLPLALDDAFQFQKTKIFYNEPQILKPTTEDMISFERQRVNFGALTSLDRQARYGQYFTLFWKSQKPTDLTIRFEYRQQKLGSYVQAKELFYPAAKGNFQSQFKVIGDDYLEEGKVVAWRAILIESGKIVGLTQSFLWN